MPTLQALFSAEWFWSYLKWFIILGVWGVLAVDIFKEDRHLRTMRNTPPQGVDMAVLMRKLHQRNILILLLLFLLFCVGILNEQHTHAPAVIQTASAPVSSPSEATASAASQDHVARKTAFEKALSSSPLPFTDITEFNEKDSEQQAYLDWLNRHYEAWLITYFYLKKCGQADESDLTLIESSLQQKLKEAGGDNTLQANILLAASGSYKEMYSAIPCDAEHFASTKSVYEANIQQIKGLNQAISTISSSPESTSKPVNAH